MSQKMEPIKYADNMRKAWQENDTEAVEKLVEMYGDQEVKLKDLEEMFSYALSLLMTAYMGKDTVDGARFDIILKTLKDKKVIDVNDEQNILKEIAYLEKQIKGED